MGLADIINDFSRLSGNDYRISSADTKEKKAYKSLQSADSYRDGSISLDEYLTYLQATSPKLKIDNRQITIGHNIDILANDEGLACKSDAAEALFALKAVEAAPALLRILKNTSVPAIQTMIAVALEQLSPAMDTKSSLYDESMIAVVKYHFNNDVRISACKSLGDNKVTQAIPDLLLIMSNTNEHFMLRYAAQDSLQDIKLSLSLGDPQVAKIDDAVHAADLIYYNPIEHIYWEPK